MRILLLIALFFTFVYSQDSYDVKIDIYPPDAELMIDSMIQPNEVFQLPAGQYEVTTKYHRYSNRDSIAIVADGENTFKTTAFRPRFVIAGGWINSFNDYRYSGVELQLGIRHREHYWGILAIGSGNEKTGAYDTLIVEGQEPLNDTTTTIPWYSFNGIGAIYQFRDILPLRYVDFCPGISAGYWMNRAHIEYTNQADYGTEIWKEGKDEWFVVAPSASLYFGGLRFGGEITYRAYIGSGFIQSVTIGIRGEI